MSLFGRKKEKEQKKPVAGKKREQGTKVSKKKTATPAPTPAFSPVENVIKHPRITEKATDVSEDHNVYTFDVAKRATKNEIAKAVKAIYKVEPVKVRTATVPRKPVSVRGVKQSYKPGGKKAYVYLKEGDSIEFV